MPVLDAEDDGHHDQQDKKERAVVLAWRTACIGITKLWQEKNFLSLNPRFGRGVRYGPW
jgi:hypothetical protein